MVEELLGREFEGPDLLDDAGPLLAEELAAFVGEQIFARASLGKPKCVVTRDHLTIYDYGNLYFNVDNGSGRVSQLGVQKKTQSCESES